jgi:hypothetical protein
VLIPYIRAAVFAGTFLFETLLTIQQIFLSVSFTIVLLVQKRKNIGTLQWYKNEKISGLYSKIILMSDVVTGKVIGYGKRGNPVMSVDGGSNVFLEEYDRRPVKGMTVSAEITSEFPSYRFGRLVCTPSDETASGSGDKPFDISEGLPRTVEEHLQRTILDWHGYIAPHLPEGQSNEFYARMRGISERYGSEDIPGALDLLSDTREWASAEMGTISREKLDVWDSVISSDLSFLPDVLQKEGHVESG